MYERTKFATKWKDLLDNILPYSYGITPLNEIMMDKADSEQHKHKIIQQQQPAYPAKWCLKLLLMHGWSNRCMITV